MAAEFGKIGKRKDLGWRGFGKEAKKLSVVETTDAKTNLSHYSVIATSIPNHPDGLTQAAQSHIVADAERVNQTKRYAPMQNSTRYHSTLLKGEGLVSNPKVSTKRSPRFLRRDLKPIKHLTLLQKILLSNLLIIIGGAVIGSWLTAQLAEAGKFNSITFAIIIVMAVVVSGSASYSILKRAFQPFDELQRVLAKIHTGNERARSVFNSISDPDIKHFSNALNQMLNRLEENARVIQEDQRQLQLMTARVINAQEDERKRIARELHDEASQSLTAMIMGLEHARGSASDNPELQDRLGNLKEMATATLEELRKLALDLRPTMLDDLGLIPAVRWCARKGSEAGDFQVKFALQGLNENERLDPQLETCLFRIAQESITNVVKYAKATLVTINLERTVNGTIRMTISDDGCGFVLEEARQKAYNGGHLGLFDIEERAALLGGYVKFVSRHEISVGTRIEVTIPPQKTEI